MQDRQLVHGALAHVTDGQRDPDRHAWHRAHAAVGLDEEVAAELDSSAARAQARGGLAAAAAFLERATMLTVDPDKRAERALRAASAQVQAGAFDTARDLLSLAKTLASSDFQQARIELIEAELAFATTRGGDAPQLLLRAAQRLESIDAGLARSTYPRAMSAVFFSGHAVSSACKSPWRRRRAAAGAHTQCRRPAARWLRRPLHPGISSGRCDPADGVR
jgi:hypothetical protein